MILKQLMPMLCVEDVESSIAFYHDAFGFEVRDQTETKDGQLHWASLHLGDYGLMLLQRDPRHPVDPTAHRHTILYLFTQDVPALHDAMKKAAFPVSDVRETDYGMREFVVTDPDGFEVWCGESTEAGE